MNDPGEVFVEAPFVLKGTSDWVKGFRVPDIMFVSIAKLKNLAANDPK